MTGNEFYALYGKGRTREQFNKDCVAFFGGLAHANQDIDANKSRAEFLHKVKAMGGNSSGFNGHGRHGA